ncbi:MAG: NADH:ubiquinone reductase (Na(+)-transporting) subunit A, partial [Acidobacteriota bacterium]
GRVAEPGSVPGSIFVNAMDSEPLAPDVAVALEGRESDFERGLVAVGKLTDGPVYVCAAPGTSLPLPGESQFQREEFVGPHPAGATGTHIHTLDPVNRSKLVWYVGAQDVALIGALFDRGEIDVSRVISLGGPSVANPRLLRTRLGAGIDQLLEGELRVIEDEGFFADGSSVREIDDGPIHRVLSGSVLTGRTASGEIHGYLGRYHQQIAVIPEDSERKLFGWLGPGTNDFSIVRLFLASIMPGKKFPMSTSTNGSKRAIVPLGGYEQVVPLDIVPTYLLKALVVGDVERAEELGALELEEDDLALCTFVCPGKIDYGPHLRDALTILEKEG